MNFAKHVKIREEKFGSVIFDTLTEKVFVTNETGEDILRPLEQGLPVDKIVDILAVSYGTTPEDIKDDIINFISCLKDNGIIV